MAVDSSMTHRDPQEHLCSIQHISSLLQAFLPPLPPLTRVR